ncbi:MAG: hypothetical protein HKN06_04805 [Gammaproteobacteria bacterium]|nr:hypothetical protein [Gammaproteobacteria bacterium]
MYRYLTLVVWVLLLAAPAAARIDPPELPGPWAVGRVTETVVDKMRNRELTVDVWYPVDAADATGTLSEYNLVFASLASNIAIDSPPVSVAGTRPLVIFSHGSFGIRYQSFFLMEHLASHGFIVVSPDHAGNTAADLVFGTEAPFEQIVVDRPLDVIFLIDWMLTRNASPADRFDGRLDPQQIAVMGHSFGGYTAIAAAAGTAVTPADPRVRVIAPIAPASGLLSDDELAGISIPALILGGTADITTPVEPQSARPFELFEGLRYRVDIVDGGHQSFTNICVFAEVLVGAGVPPSLIDFLLGNSAEGCAPELIPIAQAHALTNLYATAFLKRELLRDGRYQRYLNRGYAQSNRLPVLFRRKKN